MFLIDQWKKDFNSFTCDIVTEPVSNALAKVNLRTRKVTIDMVKVLATASQLGINTRLFVYYVLCHEYGHLVYAEDDIDKSDGPQGEEIYVHIFAMECVHELDPCFLTDIGKLDSIRNRLMF